MEKEEKEEEKNSNNICYMKLGGRLPYTRSISFATFAT